jgi:putative hydrolase of the HAD superfamily
MPVIWCDFGGVLTDPPGRTVAAVAEKCALPPEVLLAACSKVAADFGADGLAPLETGMLDEAEWGRRVTAALAPDWTPQADLTRFSELWYADRTFNRNLFDAVVARRSGGVRLAMLTNSVLEWEPYRNALVPDPTVFEMVIRSHEHGVRKPDPRIYALAEHSLGVAAGDCVLIDDSERNCVAAREVGWRAVHYRDDATALAELDKILG